MLDLELVLHLRLEDLRKSAVWIAHKVLIFKPFYVWHFISIVAVVPMISSYFFIPLTYF